MSVTIQQIAVKLGVSKATVSRVLNGLTVKYETEQRVKGMMEKMKYRPNRFAWGLHKPETGFLGLLTAAFDPFVSPVAAGIEMETRRYGKLLTLGVLPTEERIAEKEILRSLTEPLRVDGLIFFLPPPRIEPFVWKLVRRRFPVVVLGDRRFENLASSVVINNFDGAQQATQYLLQKGHRRIGFVQGRAERTASIERFEGYRQALAGEGIPLDSGLIYPGNDELQSGLKAVGGFLNLSNPPTAVFASNDVMAIGLLRALHALKKEGAFAVVGFDDIEMASLVSPSLTTVGHDLNDLGRQTVQKLMGLVTGEGKYCSLLQLKTRLIIRESA